MVKVSRLGKKFNFKVFIKRAIVMRGFRFSVSRFIGQLPATLSIISAVMSTCF